MEERLVSFKTWKLARKLDFTYCPTIEGIEEKPTQSLLQEWIWKNSNIWIEIRLDIRISDGEPLFHLMCIKANGKQGSSLLFTIDHFEDPYLLLEEGLKRALGYVIYHK